MLHCYCFVCQAQTGLLDPPPGDKQPIVKNAITIAPDSPTDFKLCAHCLHLYMLGHELCVATERHFQRQNTP